jgi:PKHD-type hydroxylase
MAHQSYWFQTGLPKQMVDLIEEEVEKHNLEFKESLLMGQVKDQKQRKSKQLWVPNTLWISGFIWHYVDIMNRENFMYELDGLDSNKFQYTKYEEGDFYNWHVDSGLSTHYSLVVEGTDGTNEERYADYLNSKIERIRKLSVIVQLSDPEDYEGGEVQIMDDTAQMYEVPKERGTIAVFDSRARHRVRKIKKGVRKSIVGWYTGPRWK